MINSTAARALVPMLDNFIDLYHVFFINKVILFELIKIFFKYETSSDVFYHYFVQRLFQKRCQYFINMLCKLFNTEDICEFYHYDLTNLSLCLFLKSPLKYRNSKESSLCQSYPLLQMSELQTRVHPVNLRVVSRPEPGQPRGRLVAVEHSRPASLVYVDGLYKVCRESYFYRITSAGAVHVTFSDDLLI